MGGESLNIPAHRLVRLNNALASAKVCMSSARMDSDKQHCEAIKMIMDAYDRKTAKELLKAINRYLEGGIS